MSLTTEKYGLIVPEINDAADITAYNDNWYKIDSEFENVNTDIDNVNRRVDDVPNQMITLFNRLANATSTDGVTYYATLPGIKELSNGLQITIIPNRVSNSTTIKLNLNSFGEKAIKLPLSTNTSATTYPTSDNFFNVNKPVNLMYDADAGVWLAVDKQKASASDLYGTLAVSKGGTGATDVSAARTNLEVYSKSEVDNKLSGMPVSGHTHDDRYYTESEVDDKLAKKANTSHTHTASDVGAAPTSHTHDDRYYTESEIDKMLSGMPVSGHTHDDRYYTETEIDSKLSNKANANHTHTASDLGAAPTNHSHTFDDVSGKLPINKGGTNATDGAVGLQNLLASGFTVLTEGLQYGTMGQRPAAGVPGRVFFVKV
jgi:hypothetical protein